VDLAFLSHLLLAINFRMLSLIYSIKIIDSNLGWIL